MWIDEVILGRAIQKLDNTDADPDTILPTDDSLLINKSLVIAESNSYDGEAIKDDNVLQQYHLNRFGHEVFRNTLTADTKIINKAEDLINIAKVIGTDEEDKTIQTTTESISAENTETTSEADETSTIVAESSNLSLTASGASEKNITYMQILLKPNDLDLNLKYAKQQGNLGNYKQTIATLERLAMLYPNNVDIKLYLLSVLVKADSPDKALGLIAEIKLISDLSPEDLESIGEIETDLREKDEPKLWNFYADVSLGGTFNQNVNNVSKTRTKQSSDDIVEFGTAKYDHTLSESIGVTAARSVGEVSSLMFNLSGTASQQDVDTTDDYESLGLTFAFDTSIDKHTLSPYLMLSRTDYATDAISMSTMVGFGNYYLINDSHSINYGYFYIDSKSNTTTSHTTADETNAKAHNFNVGYDFILNQIISTSLGLGYGNSDAKEKTNDFENFDLDLRLNLALPFAYFSIGNLVSLNEYSSKDPSINSQLLRSDLTNTSDIMVTKAIGDFFPSIDPDRNTFITLSYEKVFSESNILNYDYIADSFAIGFNKSFHLNK